MLLIWKPFCKVVFLFKAGSFSLLLKYKKVLVMLTKFSAQITGRMEGISTTLPIVVPGTITALLWLSFIEVGYRH